MTFSPLAMDDVAGVMLIPVSTAELTVRLAAGEVMPLNEAVTVVLPNATPVATPLVLIVATALSAEAQATLLVRSAVVPSPYVPVAVKLVVSPVATEAVAGVMAIAVNSGAVTVNVALLEVTPFANALMVVVPWASADAMPLALGVATVVLLEVQVTDPDTLPVVPSE